MSSRLEDQAYQEVNRRWKLTSKLLLGREVGELSEFEGWLSEIPEPLAARKSCASGGDVLFFVKNYHPRQRFASLEETAAMKLPAVLDVNSIKDFDSLARAVRESICFSGEVVMGNSRFVEQSSNIYDSFFVYKSSLLNDCKGAAYCSKVKLGENVFGCDYEGEISYMIRGTNGNHNTSRCFELWRGDFSTDCYYSHNISNCYECIFCFNAISKRHAIGNLVLPKDKYLALKKKLLGEIAEELARKKRLPSLLELAAGAKIEKPPRISEFAERKWNPAPVERAFSRTSEIVLEAKLEGVEVHSGWLKQNLRKFCEAKSLVSGKPIVYFGIGNFEKLPQDRLVKIDEAEELGRLCSLHDEDVEGEGFFGIAGKLGKIAYFCPEIHVGKMENVLDCVTFHSSDSYRSWVVYSKLCAYSIWARNSESIFGSEIAHESSFCLKCYNSKKLTRCFECDSCESCSDCYFCHNCENVRNAILCFNVKNMNYAVGNVAVGREEFARIRGILLDHIKRQVEKKGKVASVFFVGQEG